MMNKGSLLFWFLCSGAVAAFGSMFEPGIWYAELSKPAWTPPNWLFGPVWTLLYIMMAVAAWLVSRRVGFKSHAIFFYFLQLVCNGLWSWLFFGRHDLAGSLVDIVALLLLIVVSTCLFWRVSRMAGILMIPYGLWVGYAAALNLAIWRIN